jgi:LacI family transcriptional regulator
MTKHPTVVDVARVARVGASTVSRFLRGVPVRPKAAGRIGAAIKKLGYAPDETARALRAGRSRTIGIVLPKISNVFFSEATQLMEEEARKYGSSVILLTHQDRMEQQREHLLTLRRYRADGVIIVAAPGSDMKDIRTVLPNIPMVAFDSFLSPEVDSVLLRNREAARMATEHLFSHGYRAVFCVGARPEVYSIRERVAGYTDAAHANRQQTRLIVGEDYEQLRYLLGMTLRSKRPPEAILSLSDFATLHILTTFGELGCGASRHTPMIGFDDFGYAPLMDPPLTVIRQPVEKMVRYALSALFRRIQGDGTEEVQQISLPGELIRRRSCGCV